MRIETALKSPASAVIVIAIGTPRNTISFSTLGRIGESRENRSSGSYILLDIM